MTYLEETETGHICCQHSEEVVTVNGLTIETFIEETAMFRPYGAFIKGFGTSYGSSKEEAIASVIGLAKGNNK